MEINSHYFNILIGINKEGLEESKQAILEIASNATVELVEANVANEEDVKNYIQHTVDKFGKIDGFFNNAGIEGKQNLTEDYGSDEFEKVININLNGVFYGMKYALAVTKNKDMVRLLTLLPLVESVVLVINQVIQQVNMGLSD